MELISKIGGTIIVVGMILAVWKSETYLAKSLRDSRDSHEIAKDEPNNSEKPNNSTISKMEQVEDEPQTETEIAKEIVHKMIDDAVIAEDAYPDLRQKMHDAVDEYEPQTERSE